MNEETQYTSMSITSFGPSTLPDQKRPPQPFQIKNTNDVSDIEGARPAMRVGKFTNKPVFSNADIPGSTSKALTHSRNTRDLQLYIDDIEGTRHAVKDRMMRTSRHVNPLMPEYPIPSSTLIPPEETKFIRDAMNIDDIDGARTKVPKHFATRDTLNVSDIVGAQANWRPRHAKARLEAPPSDVMWLTENPKKISYHERTTRHENVMSPHYKINGMEYFDDPKYTKPKSLPKYIADNHLLQTRDIDGAYPGWGKLQRREYRNITSTADIEGAQADTIKHSIVTKRCTVPLTPVYQSLDGGGELLKPLIEPVMPPTLITMPTLPRTKGSSASDANKKTDSGFSLGSGANSTTNMNMNANANANAVPETTTYGLSSSSSSSSSSMSFADKMDSQEGGSDYDPVSFAPDAVDQLIVKQSAPKKNVAKLRTDLMPQPQSGMGGVGGGGGSHPNSGANHRGSGRVTFGSSDPPSTRATPVSQRSPAVSARGGGGGGYGGVGMGLGGGAKNVISESARRAARERQEEINAVRML